MLAATKIVYGSFVASGQSLRIEARLVDTQSAVVLGAVRAEGSTGEVLELERKIASGILGALGIGVAPAPNSGGTSVPDAAAAYYRGLAELDAGGYEAAASQFQKAAELDPAYQKPQAGLEAAYRFLKDFKRQRQQHEFASIVASLQRLRSRIDGEFYGFADMPLGRTISVSRTSRRRRRPTPPTRAAMRATLRCRPCGTCRFSSSR